MAFQALIQIMNTLNDQHAILLDLAERKKQVLIRNQVDQLTVILTKETKLIKQISEADQQRIDAIQQFLLEKGYKPNSRVTVSDLTKIIFNVEDKKLLLETQKDLLATIRKLREINRINQDLIEHSLAFINYSLDLIIGPPDDGAVYHHPQQQSLGPKRPGLFDTRA
ncbi:MULTISPECIES: flagellar protein FlgN [unclassified Paenibacillus]|uniref:flagellar protein FlgN n=1 Tax=unclassified Paenibacillus TaxID=185978 RepID=UPI001143B2E3|nr:flagellar protein FlgN [Paenibacillus sp. tmac-D7]